MKKTVLIVVNGNVGNEPEALRQSLECFGYTVLTIYVGRPNDFVGILKGRLPLEPDYIIIDSHGDESGFIMEELSEEIYAPDEPRGSFSPEDIRRNLELSEKVIISLGCMTGTEKMSEAFAVGNTYIAPSDYIE